jgi:hypothetical protein
VVSGRSGWEDDRARAERLARAEVARLEALLARAPLGSGRGQRLAAQLGTARHKLRTTLSLSDFVQHLRTTNPARYQALVREHGLP